MSRNTNAPVTINVLPRELLELMLWHLSPDALKNSACVCRLWFVVVQGIQNSSEAHAAASCIPYLGPTTLGLKLLQLAYLKSTPVDYDVFHVKEWAHYGGPPSFLALSYAYTEAFFMEVAQRKKYDRRFDQYEHSYGEEGLNYIVNGSIMSVKGKYVDIAKLGVSNEEAQCNTEDEADVVFIRSAKKYIDKYIV